MSIRITELNEVMQAIVQARTVLKHAHIAACVSQAPDRYALLDASSALFKGLLTLERALVRQDQNVKVEE